MNKFRLTAILTFLLSSYRPAAAQKPAESDRQFLTQYCQGCHNGRLKTGGLSLEQMDPGQASQSPETWEKVVRKLRAGMMPPSGVPRPARAQIDEFVSHVENSLDQFAARHPNPGTVGLHRLNRAEYANGVRDLLDIEADVSTLLPSDDSSEGFDNIAAALGVSPALLERYVSAATRISRLAVGDPATSPSTNTWRAPGDLSQTAHIEGLPIGTRGGMLFEYTFPLDAEYAFKIRARSAGFGVGAGGGPVPVEITLDGARINPGKSTTDFRLKVTAGPHSIGVAMPQHSSAGVDDVYSTYADNAGISSVAITGPTNPTGPGDTPSRRKIFICRPVSGEDETACAKRILTSLAEKAFRRPVRDTDLETLLGFYQEARNAGGFEHGIEAAVARILMDPWFIFRIEHEPAGTTPGGVYSVSDVELASRLSFFLWSSIPDEELLRLAEKNKLHEPRILAQQTRRMLADPKASALAVNFAGQWLYLRELKSARPETRDFNDNLRQSFRRETEMLFDSIVRENRSVVDLLNADYTFVDERLAKHYGIPDVYGSRFRRVKLPDDSRRGLLGQGSILLVTSVATRTSPVARGKWVLENILGSAAPLPPPNVPALPEDASSAKVVSVRERMEAHRNNPVCASCHKIMDPIGFALENFDLTGKWRTTDGGVPVDASSQMVDGTKLSGPASLRQALLSRSDVFVSTLTEKLMTYALGRGLKYYDMPAVGGIAREGRRNDDHFASIVLGIVRSTPFQMKMNPVEDSGTQVQRAALR
jgi:mono/diheme cytochrome c family protein